LSELEITSLISNDFKTTVRVLKPLGLAKIATTTDGINYTLNNKVTIQSGQWVTVPSGKTLYGAPNNRLTNKGYLQLGDGNQTSSGALKSTTNCTNCSTFPYNSIGGGTMHITKGFCYTANSALDNRGTLYIDRGGCFIISSGVTITNYKECDIENNGTINNYGTIQNIGNDAYVLNAAGGTFTNWTGAKINNSGDSTSITNLCGGNFVNNGVINNSGPNSWSNSWTSGTGTCNASGSESMCNKPCL
jgi:hypothetical protein